MAPLNRYLVERADRAVEGHTEGNVPEALKASGEDLSPPAFAGLTEEEAKHVVGKLRQVGL